MIQGKIIAATNYENDFPTQRSIESLFANAYVFMHRLVFLNSVF